LREATPALTTGLGLVGPTAAIEVHVRLACSGEWAGLHASATTAAGTPISSNVANSPCG